MKKIIIILAMVLAGVAMYAQEPQVLVLKDGTVIKGEVEKLPDGGARVTNGIRRHLRVHCRGGQLCRRGTLRKTDEEAAESRECQGLCRSGKGIQIIYRDRCGSRFSIY